MRKLKVKDHHGVGDGKRMTDKQHSVYKYLSRLWRIKREIEDKEFELWSASLASGIRYDKDSVQTSPSDPMDVIGNLIDEIREEKEKYICTQHTIVNEIHGLEDRLYEQYLSDRFIHGISIKQMNARYGGNLATTYRTFCRALDAFADRYANKCK